MGSRVSVPATKLVKMNNSSTEISCFIKDTLAKDKVVIFSKSFCPFCQMAKEVFENEREPTTVIELDQRNDGASILDSLTDLTGLKTVPQVFINGSCIGGGTDIKALHESGNLKAILKQEDKIPSQ